MLKWNILSFMTSKNSYENVEMPSYKCYCCPLYFFHRIQLLWLQKACMFLLCPRSALLLMNWNRQRKFYFSYFILSQTGKENTATHGNILTSQAFHFVHRAEGLHIYLSILRTKFPLKLTTVIVSLFLNKSDSSQINSLTWILSPAIPSKFGGL